MLRFLPWGSLDWFLVRRFMAGIIHSLSFKFVTKPKPWNFPRFHMVMNTLESSSSENCAWLSTTRVMLVYASVIQSSWPPVANVHCSWPVWSQKWAALTGNENWLTSLSSSMSSSLQCWYGVCYKRKLPFPGRTPRNGCKHCLPCS